VFVAFVIDDTDCDPADLLRPGTGSSKRMAENCQTPWRLSRSGAFNELATLQGVPESTAFLLQHIDELGSAKASTSQ
jgi:hypothetical protein